MNDLLGLTSLSKVRSSMGLSDKDLPDSVLADMDLADELQVILDSWLPTWATILASGEAESASNAAQAMARTLRVYAKYQVAAIVAVSAQNIVLESLSDGEVEGQRNLDGIADYRDTLQAQADRYRAAIESAMDSERQEALVIACIGVATPDRDPVTEGR